jgi:diguanylate cyclase (GGDEF)-like protein
LRTRPTILYFGPIAYPVPDLVQRWARAQDFPLKVIEDPVEVEAIVMRGHPSLLFVDGVRLREPALTLIRSLKGDPFSAIVPVTILEGGHSPEALHAWFSAGADEILTTIFPPAEQRARLDAMWARTQRDVAVHPSTRMPGTTEIEREIRRRVDTGTPFAVCYADLDHFKEFNDRYSYYDGDRVIYILSRILHDVVKGLLGHEGFVGHIGGDDFIFMVDGNVIEPVCSEILEIFDTLIPLQYNEQDARAGYFFGKDRRGQLHRVPLMTLSIGVVTNRHRTFTHPAEVSELATEMKSYAKTLPGSVYVVDRRRAREGEGEVARGQAEARGRSGDQRS